MVNADITMHIHLHYMYVGNADMAMNASSVIDVIWGIQI